MSKIVVNTIETIDGTNSVPVSNINKAQHIVFENNFVFLNNLSGTSANRPELSSDISGVIYLDKTLNKPIWWTGTAWIDANGTTV